jgi:hypothetical protein
MVSFGWIFFRAKTPDIALVVIRKIFAFDFIRSSIFNAGKYRLGLTAISLGTIISFTPKNSNKMTAESNTLKTILLVSLLILSIAFLFGAVSHPFLYYQF